MLNPGGYLKPFIEVSEVIKVSDHKDKAELVIPTTCKNLSKVNYKIKYLCLYKRLKKRSDLLVKRSFYPRALYPCHFLLLIEFNCLNKVFQFPLERPVQTVSYRRIHLACSRADWCRRGIEAQQGDCPTWHSHSTAGMTSESLTAAQELFTDLHTHLRELAAKSEPASMTSMLAWQPNDRGQRQFFFLADITKTCTTLGLENINIHSVINLVSYN